MSDLLPPFHKVMFSALECHLANDRVAVLESENEELQAEVVTLQWKLGERGLV